MIAFTNQIIIQRPVAEVFAFVADFENVPKWNYYVRSVTQTSRGEPSLGITYHQVRKSDQQDFAIREYQPGNRVVVQTLPGSQPEFEMRFEFADDGNGGTRLTDTWKLNSGQPALLEKLAAGRVKRAVKENLGKLKELLETGQTRLQDGRLVQI
jgi:uncharacterized membrane protein